MSQSTGPQKNRNYSAVIFAVIMGVLATILVIQNSAVVTIKLWFWKIDSSLIILLGITLGLGMLISFLLMTGKVRRLKKENKRMRKEVEQKKNKSQDWQERDI